VGAYSSNLSSKRTSTPVWFLYSLARYSKASVLSESHCHTISSDLDSLGFFAHPAEIMVSEANITATRVSAKNLDLIIYLLF